MRMDAYYYGFDPTGCAEIDRILSAVACAGKAYHHTDQWQEETASYDGHEGKNPVEWIQNAAQDAAEAIAQRNRAMKALSEIATRLHDDPRHAMRIARAALDKIHKHD